MIASLHGILVTKVPDNVIVDIQGVGYRVHVSNQTFSKLPSRGATVLLHVYTAVREDDISLYGFLEEDEKRLFQKLITVNGIGPKLALTILSGIPPHDLVDALYRGDLVRLTAISGIGKKTAERMVLDLKDKLVDFMTESRARSPLENGKRQLFEESISALVNLGYPRMTAERTLSQITLQENPPLESVVRQALKILAEVAQ